MGVESKKWLFEQALHEFNNDPLNPNGRKLFIEVKKSDHGETFQMELSVTPFPIKGPEYKGGVIVKQRDEGGFAFQLAQKEMLRYLFTAASYGFEKMQELSFQERQKIYERS